MPKIGGNKAKPAATSVSEEQAPAWFVAYKNEQEATIKRLQAELEAAKSAQPVRTASGKVYAPSKTTVEQARSLTAENLRDLAHLMVQVIPGSPAVPSNPYGTPELVNMKGSQNKMVAIKQGLDRGDYINLRKMCDTLKGDFFSYREPEDLTEEQVRGILCPILDRLGPEGAKLFNW